MFEFLKEKGEALKSFKDEKEEEKEEKSSVEKLIEFQKAKEEADKEMSDEEKDVSKIEDIDTKSVESILKEESEKKEKEKEDKSLEDKLADIEKVIGAFSQETPLGSAPKMPFKDTRFDINEGIDFSKSVAKNYVAPFIQQPTSQNNRVELLYQTLKKQNLI